MKFNLRILVIIMVIATGIRLYQFGNIPHGINRDEASIGYTAYSLLQTGKEEHGISWPLKFESFGDWKQPVYIYLLIPLIKLLGLSEVVVRIPSLIAGLLMIIFTFFLTYKISGSSQAAYVASIFLAINPWHFHFSHIALEAMVAAMFVSGGLLFSLSDKVKVNILGIILFTIAVYTYHAAIVYVPLLFLSIVYINRKKILKSKFYLISIVLFSLLIIRVGYQGLASKENNKVSGTTIFYLTSDEQWEKIYQLRNTNIFSKIIHNQYVYYFETFTHNYISAFSKEFLFNRGGLHPHYNVPGYGNFIPIEIILIIPGIIWILKQKKSTKTILLIALILAPIPGAITKDGVHSTRDIFMLPYIQVLAGIGYYFLHKTLVNKNLQIGLLLTCAIFSLIFSSKFYPYYFNQYYVKSDEVFAGYMKPISKYIYNNQNKYKKIYITYPYESPYIFYAFYNHISPTTLQSNIEYYSTDSYGFRHVKKIDNIEFIPSVKDLDELDIEDSLILARFGESTGLLPLESWKSMDGETQVIAYEKK